MGKEKLYKAILEKYARLISENESRTIAEMKKMIDKDDLTIQAIISDFKNFDFSFEKDYESTAKKVFDFVCSEIECIEPDININFWLSPSEIFSNKVSDNEDLSVFFCSLLYALGDSLVYVLVMELENLEVHSCVSTEINNRFYLYDLCSKKIIKGEKGEVLEKFSFKNSSIRRLLYRFNNIIYEQFV